MFKKIFRPPVMAFNELTKEPDILRHRFVIKFGLGKRFVMFQIFCSILFCFFVEIISCSQ